MQNNLTAAVFMFSLIYAYFPQKLLFWEMLLSYLNSQRGKKHELGQLIKQALFAVDCSW